ncbi:hypothetical protein [Deinococcus cellulosilyticus]|uniref:Uncharacterized protein n=1 Tax=Deinococcus cellulosilyticus (strain DSM 18568 / NBRC 106333 / KACC 11606 / 5516J-15) TaxID=1223518 RepID=A0A511N6U6_DEIC1|nr:hypothetical protein [Deinococcus cellulosilyticus]GEM48575.1 hypothetical protein DC3_42100 [Deinococcus cellulosilyticus NBRC 106333 = KACC 11606]
MDEALKTALKDLTDRYLQNESLEDLTDLLEVVFSLAATHGVSSVELQALVMEKLARQERFEELLED